MKNRMTEIRSIYEKETDLARRHLQAIRRNDLDEAADLERELNEHQSKSLRRVSLLADTLTSDLDRIEHRDLRKQTKVRVAELALEADDILEERKERDQKLNRHREEVENRRKQRRELDEDEEDE